jgi:ArsR family transcriptional regulator, arsenate/arsenite/antimonite-responsive transcriptional repressor
MKSKTSSPPAKAIFRALADQTRLRILHLLQSGELCVCHLVSVLDVPQPKASRHLAYLRRVGLVVARKEGQWMHYSLTPARTKAHAMLLECLSQCYQEERVFQNDRDQLLGRLANCAP